MRHIVLSLTAVSGLALPATAQRPDTLATRPDLGVRLDSAIALIKAFQDTSGVVGLSAAIAVDGRLIWSGGFGHANLQHAVEAGPEMVSRIGSISKPISAVLTLVLAQRGWLDLDEPIGTYISEYPTSGRAITTRQLLSHTSGIRHYAGDEAFSNIAYGDVLDQLAVFWSDSLLFEPGSAYSYSTYGYTVLSVLAQRVAGKPWPELLNEVIAQPLGLRTLQPERRDQVVPHLASFYRRSSDGLPANAPDVNQSNVWAGGGLVASATDLVNFAVGVADGELLTQSVLDEMWRKQTPGEGDLPYGLGWIIIERGGRRLVGHTGGTPGATGMLLLAPDDRAAVALLSNTEVNVANLAEPILRIILDR
jgi:CubicO group peptidase (beta-lactamase class C family)